MKIIVNITKINVWINPEKTSKYKCKIGVINGGRIILDHPPGINEKNIEDTLPKA